jgi:hypothetical protein
MDPLTAQDIRALAPPDFNWARLRYPAVAPVPPAVDPLESRVGWACAYVEQISFRPLASISAEDPVVPPVPPVCDSPVVRPPINLEPIAQQAILLRTLQVILQSSARYIDATVLNDYVSQFSAGSYSETRRSSVEMLRRGGGVANPQVNPWQELSDLLWLLMTDDAVYFWRQQLTGQTAPAGTFAGGDWRGTWDSQWPGIPGIVGDGVVVWP